MMVFGLDQKMRKFDLGVGHPRHRGRASSIPQPAQDMPMQKENASVENNWALLCRFGFDEEINVCFSRLSNRTGEYQQAKAV
jgi:hypothetical protein